MVRDQVDSGIARKHLARISVVHSGSLVFKLSKLTTLMVKTCMKAELRALKQIKTESY